MHFCSVQNLRSYEISFIFVCTFLVNSFLAFSLSHFSVFKLLERKAFLSLSHLFGRKMIFENIWNTAKEQVEFPIGHAMENTTAPALVQSKSKPKSKGAESCECAAFSVCCWMFSEHCSLHKFYNGNQFKSTILSVQNNLQKLNQKQTQIIQQEILFFLKN